VGDRKLTQQQLVLTHAPPRWAKRGQAQRRHGSNWRRASASSVALSSWPAREWSKFISSTSGIGERKEKGAPGKRRKNRAAQEIVTPNVAG